LRRALEKARGGEAKGERRAEEERRLAACELRRRIHELLEVLLTKRIGEMLNLARSRVDVSRNHRFVLVAHLAAGVMERRRHGIESACQPLLLQGELRGRLLASRIDEFHRLVLRLADDLCTLPGNAVAARATTAHAVAHCRVLVLGARTRYRHSGAGCAGASLLAACRFP
jgi:hypothetical protein